MDGLDQYVSVYVNGNDAAFMRVELGEELVTLKNK